MSQLESEKRYLEKSNKHLENILEATNAYKNQEVSELNRIHFETIKASECWHSFLNHCEASALYSMFFPCLAVSLTSLSCVKEIILIIYQIRFSPRPPKRTTRGPVLRPSLALITWMGQTVMGKTFGPRSLLRTWRRWPWLRNFAKCRYRNMNYPWSISPEWA